MQFRNKSSYCELCLFVCDHWTREGSGCHSVTQERR